MVELMIVKIKKNVINVLRKMNIVSVVLVALCLFACKNLQKSVLVDKTDKIYFGKVDENPLFSGKPAEEGFRKYVSAFTVYPVEAAKNIIIGRVFVEFIVERDGSVSNVKIVGGADPVLEFEALRIVTASPNWTPAKINGEAVRMSYTLPINFSVGGGGTSTSKKAKLSKKSILLEEIGIIGFSCFCNIEQKTIQRCQPTTIRV